MNWEESLNMDDIEEITKAFKQALIDLNGEDEE